MSLLPPLLSSPPSKIAELVGAARAKGLWTFLREQPLMPLPESLPDCGKDAIAQIKAETRPTDYEVSNTVKSSDGTIKWTLNFGHRIVETVLIPQDTRSTVCISTQSGCTRFCDFCATARMNYLGNLSADALVAQVLLAKSASPVPLTNVVLMGMGEPLDNLPAVLSAIQVIDEGLQISPKHVTVSSSGLIPKMTRFWESCGASLAVSIHATQQETRNQLMPRMRKWPLEDLAAWMRDATASDSRHILIQYTLLKGVNDSLEDAMRLAKLLKDIRCRVNLIPFNPSPGIPYQRPPRERILAFRNRLMEEGYLAIIRETRGEDAKAACGQLAGEKQQEGLKSASAL